MDRSGRQSDESHESSPGGQGSSDAHRRSATSGRALAVGFVLTVAHVIWVVTLEQTWKRVDPTRLTLLSTLLFIFFWLILLNLLLRRFSPKAAFTQGELLTIFSIVSVGTTLAGMNMVPVLANVLIEGTHQANDVNQYATRVLPYVPSWLTVSDPEAVAAFYRGHSSLFANDHYRHYIGPFLWWSLVIFLFLLMSFCATSVLRWQWSRAEHLTFPVIQLPVALSSQGSRNLLTMKLFWIGFGAAGGITLLNGIHFWYPWVPGLPIENISDMYQWFEPPWKEISYTSINLQPFALGLAYLIPLDLLFSFWFFAWVWKLERVFGKMYGIDPSPWAVNSGWPHYAHQMIGVWTALLLIILWTSRHHLRLVLQQAWRPSGASERDTGISCRAALIGLVVGFVGLMIFLIRMGITPYIVVPYMVMLLAITVVVARIRAEFGPPVQDLMAAGPDRAIFTFASPLVVGARSWVTFSTMTFWLHREAYMTYPSGSHIDALKMAEVGGGLNRRFWFATLAAGLLGGLLAFWWFLDQGYRVAPNRAISWPQFSNCYAFCVWRQVGTTVADVSARPKWGEVTAMVVGFSGTLALFFVRNLGVNLPLHPIAYLLTAGVALAWFWFPIFVAWLIKLLVLRYGGFRLYRELMPFFLGIILGQFMVGLCWQLLGLAMDTHAFSFYP